MKGGRRSLWATTRRVVGAATVMALLIGTVFAGTAQAASSTVKKTFTSSTVVPVPDWAPHVDGQPGGGYSTVEVSGLLGNITKVTASGYVTHGDLAELDMAVLGPDPGQTGQFAWLFTGGGLSGTQLGTSCAPEDRVTFDDSAATDITAGSPPYVGTYRPDGGLGAPLSNFNGSAAGWNGTWYFDAIDQTAGNSGTIQCWTLHIETDQGQSLDFSNSDPVAIVDGVAESGGPGVGQSSVSTSGLTGQVSAVTATVWVTHSQDADLDVILVGPTGKEVKLVARVGGNGNDFGKSCSKPTVFDDAAKTAISSGTAPFQGTFRPSEALAGFNGTNGNGTWTLKVVDNAAIHTGQLNCWSLTVTSVSNTSGTGLTLTPALTAPHPLPGSYDYAYFAVKNNTADTMTNVTLTSTLPSGMSDLREDLIYFPACDVNVQSLTCTWASLAPGEVVVGGAIARIGASKQNKICTSGAVVATGISSVKASACFTYAAYASPDNGTGYDIGDTAHNLELQDQDGNPVKLSDFAGKYVLLQFTAAWCPPSQYEVPHDRDEIAALNDSNAMGVEVVYLTVMLDGPTEGKASTQQDAINWTNHFDLTTPVLWTANDVNRTAVQQHMSYDVVEGQPQPAVPTSIFIRPDGTIFDVRVGAEDSGGTTDRLLADL